MKATPLKSNASQAYLLLVPLLVILFGFGLGKTNYMFYVPIWIVNVGLMSMAAWILGLHTVMDKNSKKHLAVGAFFLIVPLILVSMFFGLGPPPTTAQGWVDTGMEQQVRYSMLVIAGISIVFGFALLRESLKNELENFYSLLSFVTIIIAIPLFIIDMLFWGFFLTASFKILVANEVEKMPEWFKPVRNLFGLISVVEVALTYLAIAALSVSLRKVGLLGKTSSKIYTVISLIAFSIIVLSPFFPKSLAEAGFAVSIPAIPFILPYYLGVNLLKKVGIASN
jgi:hypothetical protein